MSGSRFWEFYLVRYLLGTIFGVVILFYLVLNYNKEITDSFLFNVADKNTTMIEQHIESLLYETSFSLGKDDADYILKLFNKVPDNKDIEVKQTGFPILAAIIFAIAGFLYMYFSSMVILVLHGLRSVIFSINASKSGSEQFVTIIFWAMIFIISILLAIFCACDTPAGRHVTSIFIVLAILLGQFIYSSSIQKFYAKLSLYRATSKLDTSKFSIKRKEYIESYRHLREHGNAFGIIVCELLFAFWLIEWKFSFWAVFYWSLIGFTAWILGTYLEVSRDNNT